MKLTDKRFWSGRKRKYYPSIADALKDAAKIASFWTCFVFLFLVFVCFLTDDILSWNTAFCGFLLLVCVFLLDVGIFLFENYYKQQRIINAVVSLLPHDCQITCIEYNEDNGQYNIGTTYNHKMFAIRVEYPNLWIREKGTRTSLGFLRMTRKNHDNNKKQINKFMNYERE